MGKLDNVYALLRDRYGSQGWWPLCINGRMEYAVTDSPDPSQQFEIAVGAILAQNTSWTNAAKAVISLHSRSLLTPRKILSCRNLPEAIHASRYHNEKAKKLRNFCSYFLSHPDLFSSPDLREQLVSINGIGQETADSMMLYCAGRRAGIGDAYARRILSRYGFGNAGTYEGAKKILEQEFSGGAKEMGEFHALLVEHAKQSCSKNNPACKDCVLSSFCAQRNLC